MASRPRKTRTRQKHQVDAAVRIRDITRAGTSLELQVYADGKKLGHLTLGAGSMIWKRGKRKPLKIRWTDFADLMEERRVKHR